MKKYILFVLLLILSVMLAAASNENINETAGTKGVIRTMANVKPDLNFGKFPLYFITNNGQVNEKAKFYAKTSRYTLWLTKEGFVFDSTVRGKGYGVRGKKEKTKPLSRDVSRLLFLNAHKNPEIVPMDKSKHRVNYFKGNNKSKWHGDIPTSKAVLYKGLYKNIDLMVYGIEKEIEYDWVVKPGGNPESIQIAYKNVKGTRIDAEGNLLVETEFGRLVHKRPVSYQISRAKINVNVEFKKIEKNTYGFEVGEYDKGRELVIDPVVLAYSTYLGGSNWEEATGIAVDAGGYVYVTGYTWSTDFPTLNQYQEFLSGPDVFVSKLDTAQGGAAGLIYSTYLGGVRDEEAYGIAVDDNECVYVTGKTNSRDFPTLNSFQSYHGSGAYEFEAFVTKLDTTGNGAGGLIYSACFGTGGEMESRGRAIAVDNKGNVYVTGETNFDSFPTLNAYQSYLYSSDDVFVTRIDTTLSGAPSLIYSTYLGGGSDDMGRGIAVDDIGNVYVTGYTKSTGFPTRDPYQPSRGGWVGWLGDAFVAKLDTRQSGDASLIYSTYLGGSDLDEGMGIAIDSGGLVFVTGKTRSVDFPTSNPFQQYPGGDYDAFVAKLDTTRPGAESLLYSTYLGGENPDEGLGIAVDNNGHAYVTGKTAGPDFPTLNPYREYQPGVWEEDAFVTKIDTAESTTPRLLYSTFLGGDGEDTGFGIALDAGGNAYVAGGTSSIDFPVLNQFQAYQGGGGYAWDAFVARLTGPPISITTPNGGENRRLDSVQTITWYAPGVSGNVKLTLYKDGVLLGRIADNLDPASGSYAWTVGRHSGGTAPVGGGYTIKIKEKDTTLSDVSDSPFSISRLTVTSPNGLEHVPLGSSYAITWDGTVGTGSLKITLYKDGVFLGRIADNLDPAPGSYTWRVGDYSGGTAAPGDGYTVKIKEKESADSDTGDYSFTISDITVTSPNGGEEFQLLKQEKITWDAPGIAGNLKISLYKDGVKVVTIRDNVEPTRGYAYWVLSESYGGGLSAGTGYTIKIKEKGTTAADVSDAAFKIIE